MVLNVQKMKKCDFQQFRQIVYEHSGINLSENKFELLQARIYKRLRILKLNSFTDYLKLIQTGSNNPELINFINAISTNKTSFFRDNQHYDLLKKNILPKILNRNHSIDRKLNIWSAASSTGQEIYSIAITLNEFLSNNFNHFDINLLATDISTDVLKEAQKGEYKKNIFDDVDPILKRKYFQPLSRKNNDIYKIIKSIRDMVIFRKINLIKDNFSFNRGFDIIFCKNVMIYFDTPTKQKLINKLYNSIVDCGFLIIGSSESLVGLEHNFTIFSPGVFYKG